MKIKKGKSFAIYVSSKVNDDVIKFLNKQKNVSEFIISAVEEYLSNVETENVKTLSKRVAKLEEIVLGNKIPKNNFEKHDDNYEENKSPNNEVEDEIIDDNDDDMELLFKQLND
jgi:hypothetical protein